MILTSGVSLLAEICDVSELRNDPARLKRLYEMKNKTGDRMLGNSFSNCSALTGEVRACGLMDLSSEIIAIVDESNVIRYINDAVRLILGIFPHEMYGCSVLDFIEINDRERVKLDLEALRRKDQGRLERQLRLRHSDGTLKHGAAAFQRFERGADHEIVVVIRDITDHIIAGKTIKKKERRYHLLYDNALVGMITADSNTGLVIATNDLGYRIFGYSSRYEFIGVSFFDCFADFSLRDEFISDLKKKGELSNQDIRFRRKSGSLFWGEISAKVFPDMGTIELVIEDVTKVKEAEQHVYELTFYDPLTALANRDMFKNRIRAEMLNAHRLALMSIGIDKFKSINEIYGTVAGDKLLQQIALKLKSLYFKKDMVSRYSGDQFMVLLSEIGFCDVEINYDGLDKIVQKTRDLFNTPFMIDGNQIDVTASIGICIYPDDAKEATALIKHSESAMYMAKERGRNTSCYFDASLNQRMIDKLKLERELKEAITREEFLAHYQAKVDGSGRIIGMESLIRWYSPVRGMLVPPQDFIPLAEKNGMIVHIGAIILRRSCEDNKLLQNLGYEPKRVAVNISPYQFGQDNLIEVIKRTLDETGLDPQWLELEITESGIMQNERNSIRKLKELAEIGIGISIDDFGTGYSSLSKLKLYPINTLKIDKSFVDDLPADPLSVKIAVSIVDLAHNLGFKVVAEGVETVEQLEFLKEHGCDQFQGYYFYRPLPFDDFKKML